MPLPFREELVYLFKQGWRDRRQVGDRCGLVLVVAAGLVLLFVIGIGIAWQGSAQSLPLFAARHRHLLFAGGVFAAALLLLGAHWVASDPQRQGQPPLQQQRLSLFSGRAMRVARWARCVLPIALVLLGVVAWGKWVVLPRCPPHPGKICIRVARFWDPEKQSCDSEEGMNAQHVLVRAIEDEARKHQSLAGRVIVSPVQVGVWADDPTAGSDRASKLAKRLNADLVVWGSLTKGRGADVYWVSVARAEAGPSLSVGETAQKVVISTDPCPPELSERPLLLATFVLGYGAYADRDYASAIPLLEALLSQLGELEAARRDKARVSFYLGTSHFLRGVQGKPHHLGPAIHHLAGAASLAHEEGASAIRATALSHWGTALAALARRKEGEEADRLFGQASEKFETAVKIQPDLHEALNNWGTALADWAERKDGKEADRLSAHACEKFEAAVKIGPGLDVPLNNWGTALAESALRKDEAEADRLFREACEKFEAAMKITPDYYLALFNWGSALTDWAERKEGEEADRLSRHACEKFEAAVKILPDGHEALNNWGTALSAWARRKEGEEADRLSGQACQKYEAAVKISPDPHLALYNLGNALADWAERKDGEEADRLLANACEKYQAAVKVNPDFHDALCNWGNALGDWALRKEGAEAERLFGQACEKYQAAVKIKPDYHDALNNWGVTLGDWAKLEEGAEAERLFGQACEKYEAALGIKPDRHQALYNYNWGNALLDWAGRKEGAEAERLFRQACKKYDAALSFKPDYHKALGNWSVALLLWGGRKQGAEGNPLFRLAREKALEAERIKPGAGAYSVACACARLGEEGECRRWLETALEHGTLDPRSYMQRDPDLDSVRDKDWFKEILAAAPE